MIAPVFCPRKFVAINDACRLRLAAITGGGVVNAKAPSNAATTARACIAVCSAWVAAVSIHIRCGVTFVAIAADDGPNHSSVASREITALYEFDVDCRLADNPSQAAAAACIVAEPSPP